MWRLSSSNKDKLTWPGTIVLGDSTETVHFQSLDNEKRNFIITEFFGTTFIILCVYYIETVTSKLNTAP